MSVVEYFLTKIFLKYFKNVVKYIKKTKTFIQGFYVAKIVIFFELSTVTNVKKIPTAITKIFSFLKIISN